MWSMRFSVSHIPGGDGGTYATLGKMRSLAKAASVNPLVRKAAVVIGSAAANRDGFAQAIAIRNWLEDRTVFIRDPRGAELLHDPVLTIRAILTNGVVHVDCDDVAMMGAALGQAIGLRARYVVVGFNSPNAPFRHVFAELSDPRQERWVDMDVTRPSQGLEGLPISRAQMREI